MEGVIKESEDRKDEEGMGEEVEEEEGIMKGEGKVGVV